MPDITNPSGPRPKKKLLNTLQPVWFHADVEWGTLIDVWFHLNGDYAVVQNGVYIMEDSSQIEVSNGKIIQIIV